MNLVDSRVTPIPYTVENVYDHIERCGRTCYHSIDGIKKDSAYPFVANLISRRHFSVLEHASFAFEVDHELYKYLQGLNFVCAGDMQRGIYSEPVSMGAQSLNFTHVNVGGVNRYLVSGNIRSLNTVRCTALSNEMARASIPVYTAPKSDTGRFSKCSFVSNVWGLTGLTREEIMAHVYFTYCIETDRGVTHELVRHRKMSFSQESTRYCNYSTDKFGNSLTFVKPHGYDSWNFSMKENFVDLLTSSERNYMGMLSSGATPQQARAVLPNSIKTTVVASTNVMGWMHFLNVRYFGATGAPHPDMKEVAGKLHTEYSTSMLLGLSHCGFRQESDFML